MNGYALGSSDDEFHRLERQASFLAGLTEGFLRSAGIVPGMRVLDVGCGVGDVGLIAANLVGPEGSVLGVDRDPEAVARASRRAARAEAANVDFVVGDFSDTMPKGPFDAVVGRLVLMHTPDPSAMLRRLSGVLAPGGLIAFQEVDLSSARTAPPLRVVDEAMSLIVGAFSKAGADPFMGLGLDRAFRDAGLAPSLAGGARLDGHGEGFCPAWVARTAHTLFPVMAAHGLPGAASVVTEDLEDRIRADALEARSVLVGPLMIGAWARVPG